MIRIDNSKIETVCIQFLEYIKEYFKYNKTITLTDGTLKSDDKLFKRFDGQHELKYKMLEYFHTNMEKIIIGSAEELQTLNDKFLEEINFDKNNDVHNLQFEEFKKIMVNYYTDFFQQIIIFNDEEINYGRLLSRKLGIKVCPYCNHNYIFTINENEDEIKYRPDFDHFFSKAKYPLLALSLYNLIPCCSVCNKIKGETQISFNPYNNKCSENILFRAISNKKKDSQINLSEWVIDSKKIDIEIQHFSDGKNLKKKSDEDNFIKKLGIDKIYAEHIDHVEEILSKIYAYNNDY